MNKYEKNAWESLTDAQKEILVSDSFYLTRKEMAKILGLPEIRVQRAASYIKITFPGCKKYSDDLIEEVLAYYKNEGPQKTREAYPDLKLRSIIEKYGKGIQPHNRKWTNDEILEVIKLSGIFNAKKTASIFKRKKATEKSINKVWHRLKCKPTQILGLPKYKGHLFVKKSCPRFKPLRSNGSEYFLWSDIVKHIKPDCPFFIKDAFEALSEFQIHLYGTKNVRRYLEKTKKENKPY